MCDLREVCSVVMSFQFRFRFVLLWLWWLCLLLCSGELIEIRTRFCYRWKQLVGLIFTSHAFTCYSNSVYIFILTALKSFINEIYFEIQDTFGFQYILSSLPPPLTLHKKGAQRVILRSHIDLTVK